MERIKHFLWKWLFTEYAIHCDNRINKFLKEKSDGLNQEFNAFMIESRENMRESMAYEKIRHKETIEALNRIADK